VISSVVSGPVSLYGGSFDFVREFFSSLLRSTYCANPSHPSQIELNLPDIAVNYSEQPPPVSFGPTNSQGQKLQREEPFVGNEEHEATTGDLGENRK